MTAETLLAPRAPGRHKGDWSIAAESETDEIQAVVEDWIQQPYGTSHRKERTRA